MTPTITAEHPTSPEATALIAELDAHLEPLYPSESRHGFSVQKLVADSVAFFVLRVDGVPAGCGGIKLFGADYGELKRMYVRPEFRGLGLGKLMLDHLADYARSHQVGILRLETGIHQHAAIALYERKGFRRVPPFGDYTDDPVSRCYEKRILWASLTYRQAAPEDCPLLAELNHQLIRDEGHRNRMTVAELEQRMRGWLAGEYQALIFEAGGEVAAYALYHEQPEEIYLRQLFVVRHRRSQGIGQRAVEILRSQVWPKTKRLTVAVLVANQRAVAFWRQMGYADYSLSLEILPDSSTRSAPLEQKNTAPASAPTEN